MKTFEVRVSSPYGPETVTGTLEVPNYTEKISELLPMFGEDFLGSYFARLRVAHENMGQYRRSVVRMVRGQVEARFPESSLWIKEKGKQPVPTELFTSEFAKEFGTAQGVIISIPLAPPTAGTTKAETAWLEEVRSKEGELSKIRKVAKALGILLSPEPNNEELLAVRREIL